MTLRQHQKQMANICDEILVGAPVKQIIVSVTPGGGKSLLPVILAEKLIPAFADRILWVVPRNSLKYQGEGEFLNPHFPTSHRMRASDGNEKDPSRGASGYITTYQAIGQSPEDHARFCRWHRTILFLDENHHVADGAQWAEAMAPIRKAAALVVDASGTLARGDGQKIHGLEYSGNYVDLSDREHIRVIQYSRSQAITDGAILPIEFHYLDGRSEWEKDGERYSAESLNAGERSGAALFTALRTEYALELLDLAVASWKEHKAKVYPEAKLLVVSPSIALARVYQDHLRRRHIDSLIATSDDGPAAREAIDRFKGLSLPSTDVLDTCQMAYEGLSVPAVSHIACLTHIRSIPWLEQCFARANRIATGKVGGYIYGPNDERFKDAIRSIEREQALALRPSEDRGEEDHEEAEEGQGGEGRQRIQPLRSEAIGVFGTPLFDEQPTEHSLAVDGGLTPSQAEKLLRTQISRHIEIVVEKRRPGSRGAVEKIIMRKLKDLAEGKGRAELTVDELAKQWAWLKGNYPL